jgi:hypothetical protein
MNSPLLHNPMLRYASLAGAGLPAGERHMATAATRRRFHRVAAPAEDAVCALAELTFTVTIGDGAPAVVFDGDPNTTPRDTKQRDSKTGGTRPRDAKPSRGKTRKLTLLSY